MLARRATHMYLVDSIDEARQRYQELGFAPRPTGDAGCLGVVAGETDIILFDREYAERTLPARAVELMQNKPAMSVWVESMDDMRAALHGAFLGEAHMAGLREWALEIPQGLVVLAEADRMH